MSTETERSTQPGPTAKNPLSRFFWLLVIAAVVILFWLFRPAPDTGNTLAEQRADAASATALLDPSEIVLDLRNTDSDADVAKLANDYGLQLSLVSPDTQSDRMYRAKVDPSRRDALIAELSRRPDVEAVEADSYITLDDPTAGPFVAAPAPLHKGFPNDPQYKYQWHLNQIDMPGAWPLADGGGVTVAVLDTGVAYENYGKFHQLPDLAGIEFVDPYNFVDNNTHANDDHGHGSHVTGTIAQATDNGIGVAGIARNVKIMPLKVLSASGSGSVAGIAAAIRYAADKGAKVINMSLGGAFPSTVLKKAVAYAHSKGVTVICAAGNESKGKVGYPAAYPGAVAVSATQFDEATTFYSNYGKDIDVAAPGGNTRVDQNGDGMPDGVLQNTIVTGDPTKDDYFGYMGTSMASPHVAGVAALIIGAGVTDPDAVEAILKDTSRKPHTKTYVRDRYGAGIIDAKAAVLKARAGAGGASLLLGLLIAGAVASSRRRGVGLGVSLGPSYLVGVALGASGLFFLPFIAPHFSSLPGIEMLTHGLPSWDMSAFGALSHGNPLFFSALIPVALLTIGFGVKSLRAPLAGVAIGVAAHLVYHAIVRVTDIHYIPGAAGPDGVWLALNALVCVGAARLALRR